MRGKIKENVLAATGFGYFLNLVDSRFKLSVLYTLLEFESVRYNDILHFVENVSSATLTNILKQMEKDGLVERTVLSSIPPHVEYSLTEKGLSLAPVLDKIAEWGEKERIESSKED